MPEVIVRRYDDKRVAIIPEAGMPEEFAKYLSKVAKKSGWNDFKIVQTTDQHKLLGVACRPSTWVRLIGVFRKEGAFYPIGYETEFKKQCDMAFAMGASVFEKKKEELNDIEKEMVHEVLNKVDSKEISDEELDKGDDWKTKV